MNRLALIGVLCASVFSAAQGPVPASPPPIAVVVYPASDGGKFDASLGAFKQALRSDRKIQVLSFAPDNPTFVLAATSINPRIDLGSPLSDEERVQLTKSTGTGLFLVVSDASNGKLAAQLTSCSGDAPVNMAHWDLEQPARLAQDVDSELHNPLPPATVAPLAAPTPPSVSVSPDTGPVVIGAPVVVVQPPAPLPNAPALPTTVEAPATVAAATPPSQHKSALRVAPKTSAAAAPSSGSASPGKLTPKIFVTVTANGQKTTYNEQTLTSGPDKGAFIPEKVQGSDDAFTQPLLPAPAVAKPAPEGSSVYSANAQAAVASGDESLSEGEVDTAIERYRSAIDISPLASMPRLKLARAYLQIGKGQQALAEATRGLALCPGDPGLTDFLAHDAAQVPGAGIAAAQGDVEQEPTNSKHWMDLGDAYWNASKVPDALKAYQRAASLDVHAQAPYAKLARLYAAMSEYDQSLGALHKAGASGYPSALSIISSRSDTLLSDLDYGRDSFGKGTMTREDYYSKVTDDAKASQGLADFVSRIDPPTDYKVSHLHRLLATNLLAQLAAVTKAYLETNDTQYLDQTTVLEKSVNDEMKTATIAEKVKEQAGSGR
jgi:tetratricopeptide (TPR) repeat protein